MKDAEREAFEAWMVKNGRHYEGCYWSDHQEDMFAAWQASAKHKRLPPEVPCWTQEQCDAISRDADELGARMKPGNVVSECTDAASGGEYEQIGEIVQLDDGLGTDGIGTKFTEWLDNKWDLPAGTKIYACTAIALNTTKGQNDESAD